MDKIEQFINIQQELSVFDFHAMSKGLVSAREHHFYDWIKQVQGNESLKESMGASFAKFDDGVRIAMNKLTKNPLLASPTVTAMRYFGQSPVTKMAMDQILAKRIGVFNIEIGGVGSASFNISANPSFGIEMNVPDFMSKLIMGNKVIQEGHQLFGKLQSTIQQAQSIIGVDGNVKISLAKVDEFSKLLSGAASVMADGKLDLFDPSIFNDGIEFSIDVQAHIKKFYQ